MTGHLYYHDGDLLEALLCWILATQLDDTVLSAGWWLLGILILILGISRRARAARHTTKVDR